MYPEKKNQILFLGILFASEEVFFKTFEIKYNALKQTQACNYLFDFDILAGIRGLHFYISKSVWYLNCKKYIKLKT